jgi:transcriptional regulator with XRE-family HTH domain
VFVLKTDETYERSIFAKRLTALRQENGYTQETFAKKVGFSRGRYANYEQGRREPDFEIVKVFADVLDCSVDYLLGTNNSNISFPNPRKTNILPNKPKKPKDLQKILEQEDFTLNGRMATPEDRERLIKMYEAMYWDAKQQNKRK